MSGTNGNAEQVIHLSYRKGDLITKEGDYGISIYKIIEGKAVISQKSEDKEDKEIPLATLGPGAIIGEVIFLNRERGPARPRQGRWKTLYWRCGILPRYQRNTTRCRP